MQDTYLDPRMGAAFAYMNGLTSGNEFFVSSVRGSSGNDGRSFGSAKATIAQALALCVAGDVIYVAEDHVESVVAAGGIDINVAGVSVIGLGRGSRKPTITISTLTTATIKLSAANTLLKNFRVVGNIDSLVKVFDLAADYVTVEDVDVFSSSTKEILSFFNIATTFDFTTLRGCRCFQPTDPAGTDGAANTGGVYLVDSENVLIEDCEFNGNFETAIIHNKTTAALNLVVKGLRGQQLLSGAEPFQLVAGATGYAMGPGHVNVPAETAAVEATLAGTLGDAFFIAPGMTFGNDGLAGGQGGIIVATAS